MNSCKSLLIILLCCLSFELNHCENFDPYHVGIIYSDLIDSLYSQSSLKTAGQPSPSEAYQNPDTGCFTKTTLETFEEFTKEKIQKYVVNITWSDSEKKQSVRDSILLLCHSINDLGDTPYKGKKIPLLSYVRTIYVEKAGGDGNFFDTDSQVTTDQAGKDPVQDRAE